MKKTVAVANCQACCGAYWLASAASEVVIAPSGALGEIGIVAAHTNNSAALEKEGVRVSSSRSTARPSSRIDPLNLVH
jgi:ClpP class serine protease